LSNELVPDSEVEEALDLLRDSADAIGDARADMIQASGMIKHVKALVMMANNELSGYAQEREAYASPEYIKALAEESKAAGRFETLKAKREAAAQTIGAWQTASKNYRDMKL
jgi:hypothetical protein